MQDGSFYCYVANRGQNVVSSWLPFGKGSDKAVLKKAVLKQLGSFNDWTDGTSSPTPPKWHSSRSWNNKRSLSAASDTAVETQEQILVPGAGISAQYGWVEVAGELYRMQPTVYTAKEAVIVMYGYLFSTEALQHTPLEPMGSVWGQLGDSCTPNKRGHHTPGDMAGSLEETGGLCDNDGGSHTAQVLLEHVLHVTRNQGSLQEALVDVKGCYSFLVYDSEKRTAYASRDDLGEDALFYFLDSDGCAHFSNLPLELPGHQGGAGGEGGGQGAWVQLEPGASLTVKLPSKPKAKPRVDLFRGRGDKRPAGAAGPPDGAPWGEAAAAGGGGGALHTRRNLSSSSDECEEAGVAEDSSNLELFSIES